RAAPCSPSTRAGEWLPLRKLIPQDPWRAPSASWPNGAPATAPTTPAPPQARAGASDGTPADAPALLRLPDACRLDARYAARARHGGTRPCRDPHAALLVLTC